MEILETEERKMNKNTEKKQELTHFLEHYWIYAIILVIILLHFLKYILFWLSMIYICMVQKCFLKLSSID